jgi:DNA-directed RNA polymerase specialized sigma subunit
MTALDDETCSPQPMIERLAAAFARPGVAFDDLVQEGYVGLLNAMRRFGRNRVGERAQEWIRVAMLRFVERDDHQRHLQTLVDRSPPLDDQLGDAEDRCARLAELRAAFV